MFCSALGESSRTEGVLEVPGSGFDHGFVAVKPEDLYHHLLPPWLCSSPGSLQEEFCPSQEVPILACSSCTIKSCLRKSFREAKSVPWAVSGSSLYQNVGPRLKVGEGTGAGGRDWCRWSGPSSGTAPSLVPFQGGSSLLESDPWECWRRREVAVTAPRCCGAQPAPVPLLRSSEDTVRRLRQRQGWGAASRGSVLAA